ncbi:MAG: matrixin family metalloprotease [Bacteroidota bacterium]
MRILLSMFVFLLVTACESNSQKVIVIQPFGDFPKTESEITLKQIKKVNPNTVMRENIPFPAASYYKPRNRYKASILLEFLKKRIGKDTVIIGLSRLDLSTKKGAIEDWGVMGLGYRPGNACVVSSFRLSKSNKREQFYKVALHELGHTQGLPHCPKKNCLMRDAEGGNPLDQEKEFCPDCKKYLQEKNWILL